MPVEMSFRMAFWESPGLNKDHVIVFPGPLIELRIGYSIGFAEAWRVLHQDKAESIIPVLSHASVVTLKCEAGRACAAGLRLTTLKSYCPLVVYPSIFFCD